MPRSLPAGFVRHALLYPAILGAMVVASGLAATPSGARAGQPAEPAAAGEEENTSVRPGGDVAMGRDFAERHCAACHALEGSGPSPDEAAPPLSEIGQAYPVEHLAEALAEGIVVGAGAPHMPVYQLSTVEIDDLLAYLRRIQR
jgi:mono/diheme cytochrome c family protein